MGLDNKQRKGLILKMGYLDGLASVKERLDSKANSGDFEDRIKATWLTVQPNTSVKITPLQELDEGSPNYSKKMGKARFVLLHSHPDDFKKTAPCTIDEGACYGCEQGWYQKVSLYINVLVDDGVNKPYVAIWSRGLGKQGVARQLYNIASDEDFGYSVTDKSFKLSRTGKGNDSAYDLAQLPKTLVKDVEAFADEIFDIDKALFKVTYDRQEAYFEGEGGKADKPKAEVSDDSVNADW
jgi:hypothetical protein